MHIESMKQIHHDWPFHWKLKPLIEKTKKEKRTEYLETKVKTNFIILQQKGGNIFYL